MATDNTALRVTELDFDSIKNNLKNFLRSQSEFQDFDFEGSGMSVLLDILAYNTHYMGYYLNMVGNEMFLDSAQLRASVLSHAKLINYIPTSKLGALAKVNITVTPSPTENPAPGTLTIDKYTRFLGTDINGVNYPFIALNSNTAAKISGAFSYSNVYIKQGEVITRQFLMSPTNTSRRFEIPSENVDISTLLVNVQNSTSDIYTTNYTQAKDITELTKDSTVYFLEENENSTYTIYFGDGYISKKPKDGSVIICTYVDTVGSFSNNITRFVAVDKIGGLYSDNVAVKTIGSSYGAADKESVDQIKFRAPYYYNAQNRAVTVRDYEILLLKDYTNIDAVSVWGGEDNDPIVYGKVFVSLKTKGNYELTNYEKEEIKEQLIKNRNVITVTPEIVDPDYIYLLIEGSVYYNAKMTSLASGELLELVKAAIYDYSQNELNTFNSTFKRSKLQNYIENCEKSITGTDLRIYVQKRVEIDITKTKNYIISFHMPLLQGAHEDRLYTFPEFQIRDAGNATRNVYIEEVPEALTGISNIEVVEGGRNYLTPPTVVIAGDGTGAKAVARILSGRVTAIEITDPGTNYSFATVSLINEDAGTGASAIIKLQSKVGTLRTYYYKESGEKTIVDNYAGIIDYDSGKVEIYGVRIFNVLENDFYNTNVLTLNIQLKEGNIYPLRNRILTIDSDDFRSIKIDMIAE